MIFIIKKTIIFLKLKTDEKSLRILVYHSVSEIKDIEESNISFGLFKQQVEILRKSALKIISVDEGIDGLWNGDLSSNSVAITFDDGFLDAYNCILEVLEKLNIPATFFIIYKFADSNIESQRFDGYEKQNFMGWRKVLSLKEKGFEIGCHSYSHRRLSTLKEEDLRIEIVEAKKKFEERGIAIKYFAYPYGFFGDFSDKTEKLIKEASYKACFINIVGENIAGDNLFRLKRTRISWRDNPFRFKMKLFGCYDWVDTLKLIFPRKSGHNEELVVA